MAHNTNNQTLENPSRIYKNRRIYTYEEAIDLAKKAGLNFGAGTGNTTIPPPPVPEAPDDNRLYGMRDGQWFDIGAGYVHRDNEGVEAMVWKIQHNLGKLYPNVVAYDEWGIIVGTVDLSKSTRNYLEYTFGIPTAGTAVVS